MKNRCSLRPRPSELQPLPGEGQQESWVCVRKAYVANRQGRLVCQPKSQMQFSWMALQLKHNEKTLKPESNSKQIKILGN